MGKKNIAIEVERISKIYRIGVKESIHDSLGNAIFDFIRRPLKNFRKYRSLYRFDDVLKDSSEDNSPPSDDVIWALKDVSFKVAAGEVVGIIGVNGAGKSTLLKILSHITDPTTGRAKIRGRISSLLEVGTGFHPELTGRENIYLNGTILGMRKKEIDLKFDEIVAFSGVERFIDTPVKRYSSGMRVRLAFAVSAHLEPEILLIDEVLAVGDASFQKKCLNKMHDVGEEGRTVLFVSHNMPAITRICPRTILLNNGSVIMDGPSHEVVSHYLTSDAGLPSIREWAAVADAPGDDVVRMCSVKIRTEDGQVNDAFDIRKPIGLQMEYEILKSGFKLMVYFRVWNEEGIELFTTIDNDPEWRNRPRPSGKYSSTAWITGNFLPEGTFFIGAAIRSLEPMTRHCAVRNAVAFQVIDTMDGDSARVDHGGWLHGVIRPMLQWETQFIRHGDSVKSSNHRN